jgi:hypothetical protein
MILIGRRYRAWLVAAGLVCVVAVVAAFGLQSFAKSEGNAEPTFSRIRLGMSQQEVVQVLLAFDASSGRHSRGVTTNGREFVTFHYGHPSMDDLSAPEQMASCVLTAMDSYGREIDVTLGPGGVVVGKRLSPGVWEYRWHKAYRELRDKPYRALLYKYRFGALALLVGLLLTSTWVLRLWVESSSPIRGLGSCRTNLVDKEAGHDHAVSNVARWHGI